jgi:uncharacterized protein (TIGR02300 family)
MAELDWGRKHVCRECQAPFYDMRRAPITCPKCGAVHQPVALLKSDGRQPRRNRLQPTLATARAAEPPDEPVTSPDPQTPESDDTADETADDTEEVGAEEVDDGEMEPVDDGQSR